MALTGTTAHTNPTPSTSATSVLNTTAGSSLSACAASRPYEDQPMARVTVEDCVDKIPNRFDLVLLAAQRARQIRAGPN